MKKQILTCAIALMMFSAQAQTMVVDLSTGRDHNPNNSSTNPSYPLMQIAAFDDTWKVLKPGTNTYVGAYVNNGWEPAFMDTSNTYPSANLPDNMKNIDPFVQSICPEIYIPSTFPNPPTPQNPFNYGLGDIAPVASLGRFIYRMQFNINKNCTTITAARLVVDADPNYSPSPMGIITADHITGLKLNGYTVSMPTYANNDLYYRNALHEPNHLYYPASYPYPWSSIPGQTIPVSIGDFANGTNSFFVVIDTDPNGGLNTALLMMNARLEIDYTLGGSNNVLFNLTGSNTSLCQGNSGTLNVGLNVTNPTSYNLNINPAGVNVAGSASQQSFPISPASSTNYAITITSPPTASEPAGCVTTLNWPVIVYPQPVNNSQTSLCQGWTGYLIFDGAQGCQVSVAATLQNGPKQPNNVYNGPMPSNGQIAVTPIGTTYYTVTITSPNGCVWTYHCTITVYPQPCNLLPRLENATGIEQNSNAATEIVVSPNPNHGAFTITTNGNSGLLTIRDITGKIIKQVDIKDNSTDYNIDLSDYSKGIYMLNFDTGASHISKKIVLE